MKPDTKKVGEKQLSTSFKPLKHFQFLFEKYQGHFREDAKFNSTAKEEFLVVCISEFFFLTIISGSKALAFIRSFDVVGKILPVRNFYKRF